MAKSWRHPVVPELQPWVRWFLWPFLLVAAIAVIPFLVALLPLAGLMWLGAKR